MLTKHYENHLHMPSYYALHLKLTHSCVSVKLESRKDCKLISQFYHKKLVKEEQDNPKARRRKEIIKSRKEISELENKKQWRNN